MSEELKPCPFCGCEVELALHYFHQSISGARHPSYLCSGCALRGQVFTIAEWNTRAYEEELAALREENERLRQLVQLVYERARHTVDSIEESTAWPFTRSTPLVVPTVQEMMGSMPHITGNETIKQYLEDE